MTRKKLAVLFCGELREYEFCKQYWDAYLPEDCDLFFYVYEDDMNIHSIKEGNITFIKNTSFNSTISNKTMAPGFLSYYRSISKAYTFFQNHQINSGIRYDNVMITRPDLMFGELIDRYIDKDKVIVPWIMNDHEGKIHDHFFIGPPEYLLKVSEIFNDIFLYAEHDIPMKTHNLLHEHFLSNNIPYAVEPCIYLVMRSKYPKKSYRTVERFILEQADDHRREYQIRYMDEIINNYISNNKYSEERGDLVKNVNTF